MHLSMELAQSSWYWRYYASLDKLSVTLNTFNDIRIRFKLNCCLRATRPTKRKVMDLGNASKTIDQYEELLKELTRVVEAFGVSER